MSWTTLATQISGTSLAVALDGLAGSSDARLRVLVSDGFNTGEGQPDAPFAVADSPPDVVITSPGEGSA